MPGGCPGGGRETMSKAYWQVMALVFGVLTVADMAMAGLTSQPSILLFAFIPAFVSGYCCKAAEWS